MYKPEDVHEFDGYPMPNIPNNRKPLSKEEEEKLLEELRKRAQIRKSNNMGKERKIS